MVSSEVRAELPALAAPDAYTSEMTGTLAGALRALSSRAGGGGQAVTKPMGAQAASLSQ